MSGSPEVAVVVLNFRRAEDTVACVSSLEDLDHPARIVVVDNGSDDGSVERLRELSGVELVESDRNLGFGAGNNLALARLLEQVEFVWVLNNDTTVAPDALDALLAVARSDARVGAVGAVLYRSDEPERVLTWGGGSVGRFTGLTQDALRRDDRVDYLTGASLLLRTAALREVGIFDPRYFFTWEDIDLCVRLRDRGWTLAVADRARVWHQWGATAGPMSSMRIEEHMAGAVVFMRTTSPLPWIAGTPLLAYYALRAVRSRELRIWTAAWRGWRAGWRR